MKQKIYKLLALFFALLLVGCAPIDEPSSNPQQPNTVPVNTQAPTPTKASKDSVSIEEQVIYEKNGMKVTVTGMNCDSLWGTEVKLMIENTTAQNITVQAVNVSVNDLMVSPMFSCDIAAGKKANTELTFMSADLDASNIDIISKIELRLHFFDSDSWEDITYSDIITLHTSAVDHVQAFNDSGFVAFDQSGIKIVVQKLNSEESFWGAEIYIYAENNTTDDIIIQARDVSVNGFMLDPMFSCDVAAGKKAYSTMTFLQSDLEDNSINSIDELELKFYMFDSNTWYDLYETETLTITFS